MAEIIRRNWRLPRDKGRATQRSAWLGKSERLGDPHQGVLGLLLVPQAHRQKVAPGAVLAGPLVEFCSGDVVRNQPNLFEVFGQIARASLGEVPLDARLFGLDQ